MLIHLGTQTIETSRLILRRARTADARAMFENWASDPQITRYLSWKPHKNIAETQEILSGWVREYRDTRTYNWLIVPKILGEPIGSIGMSSLDYLKEVNEFCEVGYCLSRQYWNQGFATEAMQAVLSYLLERVGFYRVQAVHDVLNPASGRVMEKCGMQIEGVMRGAALRKDGTRGDLCLRAITLKDFMELCE